MSGGTIGNPMTELGVVRKSAGRIAVTVDTDVCLGGRTRLLVVW